MAERVRNLSAYTTWGKTMQDSPASPALHHHLKLAKAYLDEARGDFYSKGEANQYTAEAQLKVASKAAEHLNKARQLDPHAVIWVEDNPGDGKYKLTQDYLNSRALAIEGVAFLNIAHDILAQCDTYRLNNDNRPDRRKEASGKGYLENARDALEKSLNYSAAHKEALKYLSQTYRELGDKENYKRIMQQRVVVDDDDMEAHKALDRIDEPGAVFDVFNTPRSIHWTFNKVLGLSMLVGFFLCAIAMPANLNALGGIGSLMLVGPMIIWGIKWYESA
jgi:hypothetical protein